MLLHCKQTSGIILTAIFLKTMKINFLILINSSYTCCTTIELIEVKELILLKPVIVKNVWFVSIHTFCLGFLFVMVLMIEQCCVSIIVTLQLPLLKALIIASLFMTLVNLTQCICKKILFLVIVGIFKNQY